MLNWIVLIEQSIYIEMDLAWNNLQRSICHETQQTNQPTNLYEEASLTGNKRLQKRTNGHPSLPK